MVPPQIRHMRPRFLRGDRSRPAPDQAIVMGGLIGCEDQSGVLQNEWDEAAEAYDILRHRCLELCGAGEDNHGDELAMREPDHVREVLVCE